MKWQQQQRQRNGNSNSETAAAKQRHESIDEADQSESFQLVSSSESATATISRR